MTDVKINTADGEQWSRMYAMALKREQVILAERARLQEALNRIVNYPDKHDCYTPEEMQNIARAALEGGQDEK
jgi:hypothetical protein